MVHVNTGALTELFSCGKTSTPVIVRLSSSELLLSKENVGIFIGPDGKPSRKVSAHLLPVSQPVLHALNLSRRIHCQARVLNLRTTDSHGPYLASNCVLMQ